jgi:hypothetical protein
VPQLRQPARIQEGSIGKQTEEDKRKGKKINDMIAVLTKQS